MPIPQFQVMLRTINTIKKNIIGVSVSVLSVSVFFFWVPVWIFGQNGQNGCIQNTLPLRTREQRYLAYKKTDTADKTDTNHEWTLHMKSLFGITQQTHSPWQNIQRLTGDWFKQCILHQHQWSWPQVIILNYLAISKPTNHTRLPTLYLLYQTFVFISTIRPVIGRSHANTFQFAKK